MALTKKQRNGLERLIAGETVEGVATALKLHRSTIYRWLQQPDFVAELTTQRAALRSHAVSRLHREAAEAANVMLDIMRDGNVHASVRLKAAEAVLDRVFGQSELDELRQQINQLKETIGVSERFNY